MFSGKMNIPEGDMKLFLTISTITLDAVTRQICEKSLNYYAQKFHDNDISQHDSKEGLSIYGRENIGRFCFASQQVKLTDVGDSKQVWTFWGSKTFSNSMA